MTHSPLWSAAMAALPVLFLQPLPAGAQGGADPRMLGKWHCQTPQVAVTVEFRANGTYDLLFVLSQPQGNQETRRSGQYVINGDLVEFRDPTQETVTGRFRVVDNDHMQLSDQFGNEYVLQRVPAAGATQPAPAGGAGGGFQPAPAVGAPPVTGEGAKPTSVALRPLPEPREGAFTILVPQGWTLTGGVVRVNPDAAGGPMQSIETKFDLTMQSDPRGLVMIRWLPHVYFADMRGSQTEGLFPPGSNYAGMPVAPQMPPQQFALQVVLPQLRPGAQNARIVEQADLPELANGFARETQIVMARVPGGEALGFRYQAGSVTVDYDEGGVRFREVVLSVMEYRAPVPVAVWCNKFTIAARAPQAHFDRWAGIARLIFSRIQWNREWVRKELVAQLQRTSTVQATLDELARLDAEITEHRRQSNAEAAAAVGKVVRGKQDAIDPATGDPVEIPLDQELSTAPDGTIIADDKGSVSPEESERRQREGWKTWKPVGQ